MPVYKRMTEQEAFTTPVELQCPITHSLFHDPVITAAGNVYERAAIQQHLAVRNVDPITGAPLASKQLTPVFLLKSRAMEYAESATHRCLEETTTPGCTDPARWLRRAVDLCEETGVRPVMLSESCVKFTLKHRSSAHDGSVLFCFAQGLVAAGEKQLALALYSNMLHLEHDRRSHTAILRRCIPCWQGPMGDDAQGDLHVDSIVAFIRGQNVLEPSTVLDILQSLLVPPAVVLKVCRQLLVVDASTSSHGKKGEVTYGGVTVSESNALLAKFMELSDAETQRNLTRVETQSQQLQAQLQGMNDKLEATTKHTTSRRQRRLRQGALAASILSPLIPGFLGKMVGAFPVVALWLQQ